MTPASSTTMERKMIAYDVIITDTAEKLHQLVQQSIRQGWEPHHVTEDKVEPDAVTGKEKRVYWQAIAKYAPLEK